MARMKSFDPDAAVATAMDVFWANGYAATTPQQLVDALGIGRGSLYNAFGSKHALFERALAHYVEQETMRLVDVLEGEGSARERVRAALDLVITAARRDRRGCLVTNAAVELAGRDGVVGAVVRRALRRQEAAFRAAVEDGQRTGEIARDRDSDALAALFLATANGIRVVAKAGAERLDGLTEEVLRSL